MALILKTLFEGYGYAVNELADQRTNDWFFVKSPISIVGLVSLYLLFVCDIGPKYMTDRKAFNIDRLVIAYNMFQVGLCTYLCFVLVPHIISGNFFCEEIGESERSDSIARIAYVYYWTKIIDLLDTIFFVLRKNQRQVTFLHVYHHALMVSYVWYVMKFYPGGQFIYIGFLNSFVHIIMYSYYLLTIYDQQYKKSVWWKKHLTQLQLLQFFIYTLCFFFPLVSQGCRFPKGLCYLILPQVLTMTILFVDFYYKNYIKKKTMKL